jgi:hypothetical protein
MDTQRRRYLAYLVRLWQAGSEEEPAWRASVENAHTGERHGFASLGELFEFLQVETAARPPMKEGGDENASTSRGLLSQHPAIPSLNRNSQMRNSHKEGEK